MRVTSGLYSETSITPVTPKPTSTVPVTEPAGDAPPRSPAAKRWLLFVHQVPSTASNARVRTWRRLQRIGAIAIKQAVCVLPDTPAARESLEWLKTELEGTGGEATIFAADTVDAWSDDALIAEFRRARQADYTELQGEIAPVVKQLEGRTRRSAKPLPNPARLLERFRQRLAAIERVDYFGSAGRDEVLALLARLDHHLTSRVPVHSSGAPPADARGAYQERVWVTRPRPGVDRMASAWLIRSFIDPRARFAFAADRDAVPADAVPFDMYGVRFTHHDGGCTFETLCTFFQVQEPAVERLAALVHALDLEDRGAVPPDAVTLQSLIDGLRLAYADDDPLLAQGMVLVDALYRAYARQVAPSAQVTTAATRSCPPSPRGQRRTRSSR